MNLNEEQIPDFLLNEYCETENNLEVNPYDFDDSAADLSFLPLQVKDDLQNITVNNFEAPNIVITHLSTSTAHYSSFPDSFVALEEYTA